LGLLTICFVRDSESPELSGFLLKPSGNFQEFTETPGISKDFLAIIFLGILGDSKRFSLSEGIYF